MNTAICITLIIAITIVALDLISEIAKIIKGNNAAKALAEMLTELQKNEDSNESLDDFLVRNLKEKDE